jgi:hypothetical protein
VIHAERHPLASQVVVLNARAEDHTGRVIPGEEFEIEDWADRLWGKSWMEMTGDEAARHYAIRSAHGRMPIDNEVVYGHIEGECALVHASELGEL